MQSSQGGPIPLPFQPENMELQALVKNFEVDFGVSKTRGPNIDSKSYSSDYKWHPQKGHPIYGKCNFGAILQSVACPRAFLFGAVAREEVLAKVWRASILQENLRGGQNTRPTCFIQYGPNGGPSNHTQRTTGVQEHLSALRAVKCD